MNAVILLHTLGFTHGGVDRKLWDIFIRWSLWGERALEGQLSGLLLYMPSPDQAETPCTLPPVPSSPLTPQAQRDTSSYCFHCTLGEKKWARITVQQCTLVPQLWNQDETIHGSE